MMLGQTFERIFNDAPQTCAHAPGRLEFIGNHTDYNGGMVLGVAIDCGVTVAVGKRNDSTVEIHSTAFEKKVQSDLCVSTALKGEASWANYALGVLWVLKRCGMAPDYGFNMVVTSDLPFGAGMSSSAALELATAYALSKLYGFEANKKEMAKLGRQAENDFVGMPCGILDQGVSAFGKTNHLVQIDCKAETFEQIEMPACIHFWVFNTEKKHALIDSFYETRHQECQAALKQLQTKYPELTCLADAAPEQVEAMKQALGENLYKRARHIVNEHRRVIATVAALAEADLGTAGELVSASHESSRHLFENSCEELDLLVDLLEGKPGVLGARLTGGGFGGAVMAVTDATFSEAQAQRIAAQYAAQFGNAPSFYHMQTGDGARLIEG